MKTHPLLLAVPVLLISLLISCASIPREISTCKEVPVESVTEPFDDKVLPDIVEKFIPPTYIMGPGKVSAENMALFLLQNNQNIDSNFSRTFARLYIEEASFEGVNHDIAFTQMCLETGFLRFGGDVKPEQNNFAGLGAIGNGEPGLSFPDPRIGVRAQIQHLKAYGSTEPLNEELVNPRFRFVRRGSAPTIEGLAGTWAADRQYAVKINSILQRLYDFSFLD